MSSVIFFLETKYFAHIGAMEILAKNLKKRKPDDHFHFHEKQNQILAKDISFVENVQEPDYQRANDVWVDIGVGWG